MTAGLRWYPTSTAFFLVPVAGMAVVLALLRVRSTLWSVERRLPDVPAAL